MRAETQSDYSLRKTQNYLDLVQGIGYHLQPITFEEFLAKPESLFMYDDNFMQLPEYVQSSADIEPVEEIARQYVVRYIMDEFEHNLLGMQDYVRWAKLFEHRCAALTPSFWAQVNMHDLMMAKDLEMDDNTVQRSNIGNSSRAGTQTNTTEQSGVSNTTGKTTSSQDTVNNQLSDNINREANATVVRSNDQLTQELEYSWQDAADNVHEVRSRNGDTTQNVTGVIDSESKTDTSTTSVTTAVTSNATDQNTITGEDKMSMTNKMYMQERQWAINTAKALLPLEWLRAALRPMFYQIY